MDGGHGGGAGREGTDGTTGRAEPPREPPAPLARRLLWFGGLWLGGVTAVSLVAWAIRGVLLR